MRDYLERVLELQLQYTSTSTPGMQERGRLVRQSVADWLREHEGELGDLLGVDDYFAEGRDGTGRKTRVPWVRFGSYSRSPSATGGFYVVYLFDASGDTVYLSLNQGTTDFVGGAFVPKPMAVIEERAAWAQDVLAEWLGHLGKTPDIELNDPGLGLGYERGNIAAVAYRRGAIPSELELIADAREFATGLGFLYAEHDSHPLPDEEPELDEALAAAERSVGRNTLDSGAGFRTNAAEIKVIEKHAVRLARIYYEAEGWSVKELGKPFDLEAHRGDETLTIEVKGTVSLGLNVVLTRNEVRHHAAAYPDNALVVVRGIRLKRHESGPEALDGTLYEMRGWRIDPSDLNPISYTYTVPSSLYALEGAPAAGLSVAKDQLS